MTLSTKWHCKGTDPNISEELFAEAGTGQSHLLDTGVAIPTGWSGRSAVLN